MRHWIGVIVIALALSTTAWAQGGKASTLTDLAKQGPDRERILYDGAKKRGQASLVHLVSAAQPHCEGILKPIFGVTIDIYRAAGDKSRPAGRGTSCETLPRRFD